MRGSAYRPPPLQIERGLGQTKFEDVRFNWPNLGQTIMLGAAGAGAIYGSSLLPDPVKTFAMIGGIGLLGYAAYSFVGGSSKAGASGVTPSTIATPEEFNLIKGSFLQPLPGSTEEFGGGFFSQLTSSFAARALISNPNPRPIDVTLLLIVEEWPGWYKIIPAGETDPYVAGAKTVSVGAGGNEPVDFTIQTKTNRWLSPAISIRLTLKKIRTAGDNPSDAKTIATTTAVLK